MFILLSWVNYYQCCRVWIMSLAIIDHKYYQKQKTNPQTNPTTKWITTHPHQSQDRKSIWNAVYWQCKSSSLSPHSGGSVLTIVVSCSIVCSCVSSCCGLLSGIIAVIPVRSLVVLTVVTSLVAIVISYVGKKYDHDNRHYSSTTRHRHQPTHLPVAFSRVKVWSMWSWFNSKAYTTWYTWRMVAYPVLTRVASFPTSTSVLALFLLSFCVACERRRKLTSPLHSTTSNRSRGGMRLKTMRRN